LVSERDRTTGALVEVGAEEAGWDEAMKRTADAMSNRHRLKRPFD